MNRTAFFKTQDVIRFIEAVFGDKQSFEIEGSDAILRSEGRRAEDQVTARTFLEQKSSDIVFSVTFEDDAASTANNLPDVFANPDYPKVLRNKYRELNRTEISNWQIDFRYARIVKAPGAINRITFRFTVGYRVES